MNITTATPSQIDARLAAIYAEVGACRQASDAALELLDRIKSVQGTYEANYSWFSDEKRDEARRTYATAESTAARLLAEAQPMEERFAAERWTRFYLVTNTGGHVHFTTACGTCFPTTQFAWLTDYSGMSHADFVQEAGALACTVCFPDAPVEQVTRIHYEAADKRAAREAREAKAAEKRAAEVTIDGWIDDYGQRGPQTKTFKTQRAVTNAIAGALSSLVSWGSDHPTSERWLAQVDAGRKGLAAAGIDYDYDKALAAARKRFEREMAKYGNPTPAKF